VIDTTTVLNSLLEFTGSVVLGLVGLAITQVSSRVKAWFAKKNVQDAVNTAAGGVIVQLASGALTLADVTAAHPVVTALAGAAFNRVEDSANAVGGVTPQTLAQLVVGAVGHVLSQDPTVATVAASPLSASMAAVARLSVPQSVVGPGVIPMA
jgi:hypothetical protein